MLKSANRWVILLAVVAAIGTLGFSIFVMSILRTPSGEQNLGQSTEAPPPSAPRTAITALGRLEPAGGVIKVAAPSTMGTARVTRLLVQEGDAVQAGQVIAVLDMSDRLLASVIQAEAQVREAQARFAQVQAGAKQTDIAAAQANAARLDAERQNAEREYQRYRVLHQEGAISDSQLDSKRLLVETTVRQLEQAIRTTQSVAEVRPTDLQQAQSQIDVAIANRERAKAEFESAVVRAPMDGQVLKVHTDPGEVVNSDGILEIGRTNQMYAIAEVYETDVGAVRTGQRAIITSNAFSGTLTGIVEQVGLQIRKNDVLNTDPAADTDVRVVEVKVKLDDSLAVSRMTNLQVKVAINLEPTF